MKTLITVLLLLGMCHLTLRWHDDNGKLVKAKVIPFSLITNIVTIILLWCIGWH